MATDSNRENEQLSESRIAELTAKLNQFRVELMAINPVDPAEQQWLSKVGNKIELIEQALDAKRKRIRLNRDGRRKKLSATRERVAALRTRLKSHSLTGGRQS